MTEGPFQGAFEADTTGVVRREITTYRYKDGIMIKETATRTFTKMVTITIALRQSQCRR